jgi:hypothetical protein
MTPRAEPARYQHHRVPGAIIRHGVWSRTLKVRGGIISQANRYLGGFYSSQRIFLPQTIQVLLVVSRRAFGPFKHEALWHQYFGQFCLRSSRTSPPLLRLCYLRQPKGEEHHATAPKCTELSQANQETAAQVCPPSVGAYAHTPWTRHLAQYESLQSLARKDLCTVVRQTLCLGLAQSGRHH